MIAEFFSNLEGAECKSQAQGQKVNLLTMQKQMIADTTALATDAPAEKFNALATRQREAGDLGKYATVE